MTDPRELAQQAIAAAERNAERNIARAAGREPEGVEGDPYAAHDAAQRAELEAEAKAQGVTPEQLQGARTHNMAVAEYLAWGKAGGVGLAEVADLETTIERERAARREAEHQRLVARVKARLG